MDTWNDTTDSSLQILVFSVNYSLFEAKTLFGMKSNILPCSIVEPIVEIVKTLLRQKARGAVIEIRIELMNNTLKS